jgi:serine/threonine protein kinase
LREVKLLEKLRHPNIITYHHSWLETTQFSSFGLPIPTLQYVSLLEVLWDTHPWLVSVLMEWAELGSLEDLVDSRLGKAVPGLQHTSGANTDDASGVQSRSARITAFKKAQRAAHELAAQDHHSQLRTQANSAIHFLRGEEIRSLLADIVSGLAFLVCEIKLGSAFSLTILDVARPVRPSLGPETRECPIDQG